MIIRALLIESSRSFLPAGPYCTLSTGGAYDALPILRRGPGRTLTVETGLP
jgi:hypothetical protein